MILWERVMPGCQNFSFKNNDAVVSAQPPPDTWLPHKATETCRSRSTRCWTWEDFAGTWRMAGLNYQAQYAQRELKRCFFFFFFFTLETWQLFPNTKNVVMKRAMINSASRGERNHLRFQQRCCGLDVRQSFLTAKVVKHLMKRVELVSPQRRGFQ